LPHPYGARTTENYLNPAAFGQPDIGTLSTMSPRNILAPPNWQFDMALTRSFQVREAQKMEIRAEAFNVTNSLRKGAPNTVLNQNTFGQITTSGDARVMQLTLKFIF